MSSNNNLSPTQQFIDAQGVPIADVGGLSAENYCTQFGYNKTISLGLLHHLYERGGIATRIISAYPDYCWATPPRVTSDETTLDESRVERRLKVLDNRFDVLSQLKLADTYSRVNGWSVIYISIIGDDPREPLDPNRVYTMAEIGAIETLSYKDVSIASYYNDVTDHRYGAPKEYRLRRFSNGSSRQTQTFGSNVIYSHLTIHESRVIRVYNPNFGDKIHGTPMLTPIVNDLYDKTKISSATAVNIFSSKAILHVGTKGFSNLRSLKKSITDSIGDLNGSRSRVFTTNNDARATFLNSEVTDPTNILTTIVRWLGASVGIPLKILLAYDDTSNSTNDVLWGTQVNSVRRDFCNNMIIKPFLRKLNDMGILNSVGFNITWKTNDYIDAMSESEIAKNIAVAISTIANSAGANQFVTRRQVNKILGIEYLETDLENEEPFLDMSAMQGDNVTRGVTNANTQTGGI